MNKLLALIILIPAVSQAAPAVTGVGGVLATGETITIAGSSFGTKSTAAPVRWDDAESGVVPSEYYNSSYGIIPAIVSGVSYGNGDKSYYANMYPPGKSPRWWDSNITRSQYFYYSYQFKLGANFDVPQYPYCGDCFYNMSNVKIFRVHTETSAVENFFVLGSRLYASSNMSLKPEYIADPFGGGAYNTKYFSVSGGHWTTSEWLDAGWHNLQFEYKDSAQGAWDGEFRMWYDGTLLIEVTGMQTQEDQSGWKALRLGWENSAHGVIPGSSDPDDLWFDEIYVDNTWARVELGDRADYNSCTNRVIQVPSAWSASSITVTCNAGSFADASSVYMFVVDSGGSISTGYGPLTVSNEYVPPAATTITRPDSLKVE